MLAALLVLIKRLENNNVFIFSDVFPYQSVSYWFFGYWILLINNLLPFPLILLSCGVSVYQLKSPNMPGAHIKRQASITIVILTLVYIVCNVPLCVLWVFSFNDKTMSSLLKILGDFFITIDKSLSFNSVGFNSVCNILVYFWRMQGLREHVRGVVEDVRKRLFNSDVATGGILGDTQDSVAV